MPAIDKLAESESDVEVVWRAFELRPEPTPLPDATSDFFVNMWEQSIYPLAETLGVKIKMPEIKPRSRIAHEAAKWAASFGKSAEFRDTLFRAYFERGEDIGEKSVLLRLGESLEMDSDELKEVFEGNQFLPIVLADETAAVELGLNGVPAYIADRKSGMMGIQSFENLEKLIGSVRS